MAYLDKKETDKLRKLKQSEAVWLCGVREGKLNLGDAMSLGIRPHYVLVLDATSQDIRLFDVAENAPDVTAMAQRLAKAMLSPGEALAGSGLAGLLQRPASGLFVLKAHRQREQQSRQRLPLRLGRCVANSLGSVHEFSSAL